MGDEACSKGSADRESLQEACLELHQDHGSGKVLHLRRHWRLPRSAEAGRRKENRRQEAKWVDTEAAQGSLDILSVWLSRAERQHQIIQGQGRQETRPIARSLHQRQVEESSQDRAPEQPQGVCHGLDTLGRSMSHPGYRWPDLHRLQEKPAQLWGLSSHPFQSQEVWREKGSDRPGVLQSSRCVPERAQCARRLGYVQAKQWCWSDVQPGSMAASLLREAWGGRTEPRLQSYLSNHALRRQQRHPGDLKVPRPLICDRYIEVLEARRKGKTIKPIRLHDGPETVT